ncbi:uncharacterized protein LOC113986872 [Pipra filicauda]|uniref:Uncharacterized protein LOC113986872 n=1 Tax=Pipra filicauda TaxID=649802 RepID=A0A7R5KPH6_9PASS|nr:uncharacterized protein LOC113986872 [Pipra filicauda]
MLVDKKFQSSPSANPRLGYRGEGLRGNLPDASSRASTQSPLPCQPPPAPVFFSTFSVATRESRNGTKDARRMPARCSAATLRDLGRSVRGARLYSGIEGRYAICPYGTAGLYQAPRPPLPGDTLVPYSPRSLLSALRSRPLCTVTRRQYGRGFSSPARTGGKKRRSGGGTGGGEVGGGGRGAATNAAPHRTATWLAPRFSPRYFPLTYLLRSRPKADSRGGRGHVFWEGPPFFRVPARQGEGSRLSLWGPAVLEFGAARVPRRERGCRVSGALAVGVGKSLRAPGIAPPAASCCYHHYSLLLLLVNLRGLWKRRPTAGPEETEGTGGSVFSGKVGSAGGQHPRGAVGSDRRCLCIAAGAPAVPGDIPIAPLIPWLDFFWQFSLRELSLRIIHLHC